MTAPEVYGLVLIGGRSSRMGTDKSLINYHGINQREHVFKLLEKYCTNVFLSCNKEQSETIDLPCILDIESNMGPTAGIISAFTKYPNVAWLVVACDMPNIDEKILERLINQRNHNKLATCFFLNFPEPLCAIWEPAAFKPLKKFIEAERPRPRVFLETHPVHYIKADDPWGKKLMNVNTPEEKRKI